jgi:hypothetical protein
VCVAPTPPPTPGLFAGAKLDGVFDQGLGFNAFALPLATPASLNTGNVGGNATGVELRDDWVEFGFTERFGQLLIVVCFDVTSAGRISFRLDLPVRATLLTYTLVLASSSFAGCGIRYNGDSTILDSSGAAIQTGNPTISAAGAVTLTFPETGEGSATWQLVNCTVSEGAIPS